MERKINWSSVSLITPIVDNIIGDMTKHLNLIRAYVYKLFKKHLGCSPSEYLEQYRIDRACSILKHGQFSTNEVAYAVGYVECSSFFKVSKERTGITLKQYQIAYMNIDNNTHLFIDSYTGQQSTPNSPKKMASSSML